MTWLLILAGLWALTTLGRELTAEYLRWSQVTRVIRIARTRATFLWLSVWLCGAGVISLVAWAAQDIGVARNMVSLGLAIANAAWLVVMVQLLWRQRHQALALGHAFNR